MIYCYVATTYVDNGCVSVRVEVPSEMISWARQRSGLSFDDLARRFPKLPDWEAGESAPTFKQLESYANATHTPFGLFFLPEPPEEELPLPDFRRVANAESGPPSADLLDVIFDTQRRQVWFRQYAQRTGQATLPFVGSMDISTPVASAASAIGEALIFPVGGRGSDWSEAYRKLTLACENLGILVMTSGIVGNNTRRKLDPREFRGFALVDDYAPLVFVNGSDTKAAQIFTLVHEVAHIYAGQSALSDVNVMTAPENEVESWCNSVAGEILVPRETLQRVYSYRVQLMEQVRLLAARFKVSTLVVLRRLFDCQLLGWEAYRQAYDEEFARVMRFVDARRSDDAGGGSFYNTHPVRISRRFARAIISSALEGDTLYRDAFSLLGIKKLATFNELAQRLGVAG